MAPQILEALAEAIEGGLRLPIVYNTSAYDSLDSITSLNGIVDIYMPDFEYWSTELSTKYMKAADYPDAARASIKAMHQQVGPLVVDDDGLAKRGLLIRHLGRRIRRFAGGSCRVLRLRHPSCPVVS